MKQTILILTLLCAAKSIQAQVGIGTSSPASSSILDVTSTSKGFLPPRMASTQRDAISSPIAGLIIWCTDCGSNGELQTYNGTKWTNLLGGESGTSSPAGGTTSYAVRINYDTNTEPDTAMQLTSSTWSSNSVTVTINSVTNVVFEFPSESAPPIAVNTYFYNGNIDKYILSTMGLGNNNYANGQGFTSTVSSHQSSNPNQATNNFFSAFSTDSKIKLNLTPNNYGGSKKNLPPVYVHCYVVFTFP